MVLEAGQSPALASVHLETGSWCSCCVAASRQGGRGFLLILLPFLMEGAEPSSVALCLLVSDALSATEKGIRFSEQEQAVLGPGYAWEEKRFHSLLEQVFYPGSQ